MAIKFVLALAIATAAQLCAAGGSWNPLAARRHARAEAAVEQKRNYLTRTGYAGPSQSSVLSPEHSYSGQAGGFGQGPSMVGHGRLVKRSVKVLQKRGWRSSGRSSTSSRGESASSSSTSSDSGRSSSSSTRSKPSVHQREFDQLYAKYAKGTATTPAEEERMGRLMKYHGAHP